MGSNVMPGTQMKAATRHLRWRSVLGLLSPRQEQERVAGILHRAIFVLLAILLAGYGLSAQIAAQNAKGPAKASMSGSHRSDRQTQTGSNSQTQPAQVTLPELVGVALARNPAIKSAAMRVEALRAAVPQAKSLPDPTVSTGWIGNIAPFDVQTGFPPSYRGLTVAEHFPFPGKLKLRGRIAGRKAAAAWWKYENTRRKIVAQVKEAYYQYFYYYKATAITKKDKNLLQKLEAITESLYRVGKGIQENVLRAPVEVSRIDQRLIVLSQQEKTAKVRLNTLLYRDPQTPVPPPVPFKASRFIYTLPQLYQMARENDPDLQRDRRMIEANRDAVRLAQKASDPNFTVSYAYLQRPMLPDSQGFMVGINIPIFYKSKQRQGVIQAADNLTSSRRALDNQRTTVYFKVKQEYLAAKASENLARLYSKAIVPQSSEALESAMSSYEVGKLDFLSMLGDFINVLDYEVGYYRESSDFEIALARLEPLVGTELTTK